ncbi:MAG: transposase [Clostridia bacterium]|nr:transposase [Clostridia bacterium]
MKALSKRKPTRLKGYDYSMPGAYFVTVCTKNKKCIFGKIVGDGDFDVPKMNLSKCGTVIEKHLNLMNEKYNHIKINSYVIMPNHIHLILNISDFVGGASETAAPYNNEISKFISLLKRYSNRECGENLFQRSFHDHIIRNENDYIKISEYIETNVLKWKEDCFYDGTH